MNSIEKRTVVVFVLQVMSTALRSQVNDYEMRQYQFTLMMSRQFSTKLGCIAVLIKSSIQKTNDCINLVITFAIYSAKQYCEARLNNKLTKLKIVSSLKLSASDFLGYHSSFVLFIKINFNETRGLDQKLIYLKICKARKPNLLI